MKPYTAQPVTLSFALWATASISHAQLQPMDEPEEQPVLKPMNATAAGAGHLVSMAGSQAEITATLVPMVQISPSSTLYLSPTLTAMVSQTPIVANLVSMEKRTPQVAGPLVAMVKPKPDSDVTLTPLSRRGKPQAMRGNENTLRGATIMNPVEGIGPLPPQIQGPSTNPHALVLPKPAGSNRIIRQATSANGSVSTAPDDSFPLNPLNLSEAELSPNPNIPTISRPEEEMIAVDIVLNGIPRKGIMEVYLDPDNNLWLPLTPMATLLELPLSINAAAGVAQGWYQSPSNTLLISMAGGQARIGANTYPTGGNLEKHSTDLYITSTALKQWLNVDTTLNFNLLQLIVKTPGPLPGDIRAARLNKWELAEKARALTRMPSDTIIPEYADFSLPVIRLGASTNYTQGPGVDAATATGLTLQSQNDFMGLDSQVALSFTRTPDGEQKLSRGNLLLQKQSDEANLLGPLNARYFGIGDVTTNALNLSGITSAGRGFRVNNTPRGAINNPDQYVLTGPAPINWDVEVYQNQSLVGFSRIDGSGTYRFTALPLRAGRNQFRIVLYGPNGEREERQESIYLGDNIPEVGDWQYEASIIQPNQKMFEGLNANDTTSSTVITQAQLTTGLTSSWAATLGAFQTIGLSTDASGSAPTRQGATAGLRGSIRDTYITTDVMGSSTGQAAQASLRTPLANGVDLRLTQTRNFGFLEEERNDLTTTSGEINSQLKLGKSALNTTYGYTNITYQNQDDRNEFNQRTSANLGRINATNNLIYAVQGNSRVLNGTLEASTRFMDSSLRAGLSYQPTAQDPLQLLTLGAQLPVLDNRTLNLTYTQQLSAQRTARLGSSLNWQAGPWVLGVQGQVDDTGASSVGLNVATALVPNGYREARWKLAPPNATIGQGQAAIRVYVDENADGRFTEGEQTLPNVTIYNRLRGTQVNTDSKGIAKFTDITPNTLSRFGLETTTLPDIYLKPVSDTLNVKAHTGDNGIINYAITVYGEISGLATTASGQPVQNLQLELLNGKQEKVDTYLTEYDGYYNFGALPMGTYTLQSKSGTGMVPATITLTPKTRIQQHKVTVTP